MFEVAIIGAGPYGLSCAACLRALGIEHAIFGQPMQTWREAMPEGMHLKSDGFASNLRDSDRRLTLEAYCAQRGEPYADSGLPVPLATFVSYALDFQAKAVPHLDRRSVSSVDWEGDRFVLRLDDGSTATARRVIMAVGITYFRHMPAELAALPRDLISHSGDHHSLAGFRGRSVTVLGAGASALDVAMLLHEAGADVQLVARRTAIAFHSKGAEYRPLLQRIRHPRTQIGPGWQSMFYTKAPALFRRLPQALRVRQVKRALGPAPGWFVRERVEGRFPFHLGSEVRKASANDGRVALTIVGRDGRERELVQDHVIAGTGYRVDIDRIAPLAAGLRSALRRTDRAPLLSGSFESSVPGLYFVGPAAANSFGPLMRFACGAEWAAPRVARHVSRSVKTASRTAQPLWGASATPEREHSGL
jgi:thioredoxin reductase